MDIPLGTLLASFKHDTRNYGRTRFTYLTSVHYDLSTVVMRHYSWLRMCVEHPGRNRNAKSPTPPSREGEDDTKRMLSREGRKKFKTVQPRQPNFLWMTHFEQENSLV